MICYDQYHSKHKPDSVQTGVVVIALLLSLFISIMLMSSISHNIECLQEKHGSIEHDIYS
jgi:hypothetical protein